MIFNKDSQIPIKVVSTVKGLSDIDVVVPKPANKYLPDWWKTVPTNTPKTTFETLVKKETIGTVRTCPAFPDYFSQGIVIPMWADTLLKYDPETEEWHWYSSDQEFVWETHSNKQFLSYVPFKFFGKQAKFIFKAICPWKIITPKGYSVYQQPLFYHFQNDFAVLPGVIDTDVHHTINQQVVFLSDEREFIIKRGTPFVQYIPFKRESYDIEVRDCTENDIKQLRKNSLYLQTKFPGSRAYAFYKNLQNKDKDE